MGVVGGRGVGVREGVVRGSIKDTSGRRAGGCLASIQTVIQHLSEN